MLNIVPALSQGRLTPHLWEKIITEYCHEGYDGWYWEANLDDADP